MKNTIMLTAMLIFIGCGEAEATTELVVETIETTEDVDWVKNGKWITAKDPVEVDLDNMTFASAFRVQYLAKGEGQTFWWNGNEYTTDLAQINKIMDEFVVTHAALEGINKLGWVLNDDDTDDNCRSNRLDDCGVCDGPGKFTWFRDKDGDGLGTFTEWITSCTYPKDVASR